MPLPTNLSMQSIAGVPTFNTTAPQSSTQSLISQTMTTGTDAVNITTTPAYKEHLEKQKKLESEQENLEKEKEFRDAQRKIHEALNKITAMFSSSAEGFSLSNLIEDLCAKCGEFIALLNGQFNAAGQFTFAQGVSSVGAELQNTLNSLQTIFKINLAEEDPDFQDQAETLVNTVLKVPFETIKPPLQAIDSALSAVGAAIPGVEIGKPVSNIIEVIDALETIATIQIPTELLNKLASSKTLGPAFALSNAQTSMQMNLPPNMPREELLNKVKAANDAAKAQSDLAESGVQDSFKNLPTPDIPKDVEKVEKSLITTLQQFTTNIYGCALSLIFGLIGQIVKAFNDIIGVIGVPSLPSPLSDIVELIPKIITIFQFIMKLPQSLVTLFNAIIIKKAKIISLAADPPPPLPSQPTIPLPPSLSNESKEQQQIASAFLGQIADYKFAE